MCKLTLDLVPRVISIVLFCIAVCKCQTPWTKTYATKLSICYSCCSFNHALLLYVIIGTLKCQSLCSRVVRAIACEIACKWEGLHWWLDEWYCTWELAANGGIENNSNWWLCPLLVSQPFQALWSHLCSPLCTHNACNNDHATHLQLSYSPAPDIYLGDFCSSATLTISGSNSHPLSATFVPRDTRMLGCSRPLS